MKKLFIYLAIISALLLAKVTGLILWPWANIAAGIGAFIGICILIVLYGFISAARNKRKTRKFWEMYRKDHEELIKEED